MQLLLSTALSCTALYSFPYWIQIFTSKKGTLFVDTKGIFVFLFLVCEFLPSFLCIYVYCIFYVYIYISTYTMVVRSPLKSQRPKGYWAGVNRVQKDVFLVLKICFKSPFVLIMWMTGSVSWPGSEFPPCLFKHKGQSLVGYSAVHMQPEIWQPHEKVGREM